MSEVLAAPLRRLRHTPRRFLAVAGWLVLLVPPFYLSDFWLQIGLLSMAAVIAAVGLNLLAGTAGQLSLGHAFFLAVGAYGYTWLAADPHQSSAAGLSGAGLPPAVAFVAAVVLSGAVGALFSPISGRLRHMYLGVATVALVFIGQHVLSNAVSITGGYNGRSVPPLEVFGFSFSSANDGLTVLNVPFGVFERLWFLGLLLMAIACWAARNLLRGRPGRALGALRDSETAAAVMGVNPARYRAAAFTVSSMFAGAAGVLLALVFQRIVPDYFDLTLSLSFLAMVVIGGLGSVAGAAAGAVFVTLLPQLLSHYADQLPLVVPTGSATGGLDAADAASFLYGAALVLTLLFAPGGLAGLLSRRLPRPAHRAAAVPQTPGDQDHVPGEPLKEQTS